MKNILGTTEQGKMVEIANMAFEFGNSDLGTVLLYTAVLVVGDSNNELNIELDYKGVETFEFGFVKENFEIIEIHQNGVCVGAYKMFADCEVAEAVRELEVLDNEQYQDLLQHKIEEGGCE